MLKALEGLLLMVFSIMLEKVAPSKKDTQFMTGVQKPYPI